MRTNTASSRTNTIAASAATTSTYVVVLDRLFETFVTWVETFERDELRELMLVLAVVTELEILLTVL